jgi:hypothetical protein
MSRCTMSQRYSQYRAEGEGAWEAYCHARWMCLPADGSGGQPEVTGQFVEVDAGRVGHA